MLFKGKKSYKIAHSIIAKVAWYENTIEVIDFEIEIALALEIIYAI